MGTLCLIQLRISILMIILAVFTFFYKKNMWKDHFSKNKYLYLTWFFTFIPVFGSNSIETRTIFFTECIALIVTVDLLLPYLNKYDKGTIICCNVATLLVYGFVLKYTIKNYQNYKYILQQLKNPNASIISVPQITELNNKFLNSYIREPIKFGPFENAQGFVQNNIHIKCMKILHHKKTLYLLPEDIVVHIYKNDLQKNHFIYNKNKEMIIVKQRSDKKISSVSFKLNTEDISSLPFYKRFLTYKGNIYSTTKEYFETFSFQGENYLFICCPTNNIKRRIQKVIYH